ncbi:MAG: glycoside hydrolase family 5 protein [Suipraeoptans sp.]
MIKRKKERKKKIYRRVIYFFISILVVSAIILGYFFLRLYFPIRQSDIALDYNTSRQITDDDYLAVSGTDLVNRNGETVVLKGVNLGGWLLQEYWMCPVRGDPEISQWTYHETIDVLEDRFGTDKTTQLVQLYEDNWITEWDIQNIAELGYNAIRVPFWYKNFMSDASGTWLSDEHDDNPGFQTLDELIKTAGENGIYVILDMHGCPGGQSKSHTSSSARESELFENDKYQDVMEELWLTISSRYKDNPVVAMYDIMNEAQEYEGDVSKDPRNIVYNRMVNAIQGTGDEHIIAIEAIWWLDKLPTPSQMNWTNVVYSLHPYDIEDKEGYCQAAYEYSNEHNVPIYFGEFQDKYYWDECERLGFSATSWTYKGSTEMERAWFMYYSNKLLYVDVYNDPYWLIKIKWGSALKTKYFTEDTEAMAW